MKCELKDNLKCYEVLTPAGFKSFAGIKQTFSKETLTFEFNSKDISKFSCTLDHILYKSKNQIYAKDINVGDKIDSKYGLIEVISKECGKEVNVFDLLNVEGGNLYYTNDIVSHNCFLDVSDTAIDEKLIEKLQSRCLPPIHEFEDGAYQVWEDPIPTHIYVIGVDVGEGVDEAASVAQILDITDLTDIRQTACYYTTNIDPFHFATKLHGIAHEWGKPYLLIERNNCGGQIIDNLYQTHGYSKIVDYTPEKQKYYNRLGIYSHTNSKYKGVTNMRYWLNSLEAVTIRDMKLVDEFKTFVRHANGTWKKLSSKYKDDRVLSFMWGIFALETIIAEKYFDVIALDRQGKPKLINSVVVEDPTLFKLDSFYTSSNAPPPIHFGFDPAGTEEGTNVENMNEQQLINQGWKRA